MGNKKKKIDRYNIVIVFVYIVGIVLLLQLFNLQVVHGQEYREASNTRLTRETVLYAARGSILDRTGQQIATNKMGFSLELYKTKSDDESLNNTILNMINVLSSNGDTYIDSFPIDINPIRFNLSSEDKIIKFKEKNKIDKDASVEEAFNVFRDKYKIKSENIEDVRKIMGIRYEITQTGYSSTKAIKIAKNISRESVLKFNEQNFMFPGINIIVEPVREYMHGNLASHLVGYMGRITTEEYEVKKDQGYSMNDSVGKIGVEGVFEEYLKGQNGIKLIDMTVEGNVSGESIGQEAIKGNDIVLTIDAKLQASAELALENNINKIRNGEYGRASDAKSGAIVAMKVDTGEILAMASYPSFNPGIFINGISQSDWEKLSSDQNALFNRAIQGTYAPGSIYKMATAVAGLETGAITYREKIQDRGVYDKGHHPVCWIYAQSRGTHGYLNVSDAIKHSCNYFFYETGYRTGIDNLEKYSRYFGLGEKTGIQLYGEESGTLSSKNIVQGGWQIADTLSSAIGQSYNSFTPIQIAKYVSMLANGGKQIKPTIVKSVINPDAGEVSKAEVQDLVNKKLGLDIEAKEDLPISQENLNAILEGMKHVTSETGGTAYARFKDFPIVVGGKTGSAQTGIEGKTNGWFVGFGPYDAPEIVVVVFVEGGGSGGYTSEAALDVFREYFGMNEQYVIENMTAVPYTEVYR